MCRSTALPQARLDYRVEEAIRAAVNDRDFEPFNEFLKVLEQSQEERDVFAN